MAAISERSGSVETVLVLGCGDLGVRLAKQLGDRYRVIGVRRDIARLPPGVVGLAADYSHPGALDGLLALAPDYVVTTLKPLAMDAQGYRRGFSEATANLLRGLGGHRPRAMLMVSSTRVYAEQAGGWVDEDAAVTRDDPAAGAILEAEAQLLGCGAPAAVLRCGGIYGDPCGRLLARIAGGHICAAEPVRYSNRIHREDVAAALCHLLTRVAEGDAGGVYLGVDGEGAAQHAVESWIAGQLGVEPIADRPPPGKHKRCRGDRLSASGYRFMFPDYRRGYSEVLDARQRRGGEG